MFAFHHFCAVSLLLVSSAALAAEPTVGQQNKAFTVTELVVKSGTAVKFSNEDPFFHNVFSLSGSEGFDLGAYGQGESRSYTFEEKGTFEVECAIHPEMKMTVVVE